MIQDPIKIRFYLYKTTDDSTMNEYGQTVSKRHAETYQGHFTIDPEVIANLAADIYEAIEQRKTIIENRKKMEEEDE